MSRSNGVSEAVLNGLQELNTEAFTDFVLTGQGLEFAVSSIAHYSHSSRAGRNWKNSNARGGRLSSWLTPMLLLAVFTGVARADSSRAHSNTVLSGISCNAVSITGAATDPCTVSLSGPAPKGGVSVALSSSSAAVYVPATVTIPTNATSVAFTTAVSSTQISQTVNLIAAAGGVSKNVALQLNPATSTLSPSLSSISFGDVVVNTAAKYSVTLASTGTSPVTINGATVAGAGFTVSGAVLPATLNPGQSLALAVQFSPTVAGAVSGQLAITSTSSTGSTAVIALSGTGDAVPVALSALACSNAAIVGAGTDTCTVKLNAAAPSGGLSVSLSSSNTAVSVPATVTVPANATSAGFMANVASVSSGQTASLSASAGGASASFVLQLQTASVSLSANATSVPFGSVVVNSTSTQYVTLTSTGTAPVTVNGAALTGTGFTLSGAAFPVTLNPNQTTTLTLQFDPAVTGSASGQLTVTSNSSTSPNIVIGVSGTGIVHEVDLSWVAPSGSADPVAGYNIYRSPSGASSYQRVNTSTIATTTYTDFGIQSGASYDYAVTSVDSAGAESAPSNTIAATIP